MVRIHCGENIELQETSREIFSSLYIECDDIYFPSKDWTDFSLTVLEWWVESVSKSITSNQTKFSLLFEDGPWRLDVDVQDHYLNFCGFDDYVDGNSICQFSMMREELTAALCEALVHLRDCVDSAGMNSFGIQVRIDKALSSLQKK